MRMYQSSLETPVVEQVSALYHPAPLATLRPNCGAHFELYIALPGRGGRRYMLYKSADIEFTDKRRQELLENGVSTLYVREDDAGQYYDYVDRNVGQVLSSDYFSPQEKSQVLYETSNALVKSTFERPDSPLLMSTNQKVITHAVSAVASDPNMLRTMVSLFAFDYGLYTHSVHVAVLGMGLLLEIDQRPEEDVRDVAMGYLLHDIGKCRVPADIVRKPGMLSPWEIKQMERHPDFGVGLMQHHEVIRPAAVEVIRNHHERMDGSGYPRHLSGSAIALETRVCSVADVFDAFTSHRVYRPALSAYDALRHMLARMPHELDEEILHLLVYRLGPNARASV
jgi:HD-GYP domain-containing protein (c-di-GMP phosphodiesterase class II)